MHWIDKCGLLSVTICFAVPLYVSFNTCLSSDLSDLSHIITSYNWKNTFHLFLIPIWLPDHFHVFSLDTRTASVWLLSDHCINIIDILCRLTLVDCICASFAMGGNLLSPISNQLSWEQTCCYFLQEHIQKVTKPLQPRAGNESDWFWLHF